MVKSQKKKNFAPFFPRSVLMNAVLPLCLTAQQTSMCFSVQNACPHLGARNIIRTTPSCSYCHVVVDSGAPPAPATPPLGGIPLAIASCELNAMLFGVVLVTTWPICHFSHNCDQTDQTSNLMQLVVLNGFVPGSQCQLPFSVDKMSLQVSLCMLAKKNKSQSNAKQLHHL